PSFAEMMRDIVFSIVDLPQPFGPMIVVTFPSISSMFILCKIALSFSSTFISLRATLVIIRHLPDLFRYSIDQEFLLMLKGVGIIVVESRRIEFNHPVVFHCIETLPHLCILIGIICTAITGSNEHEITGIFFNLFCRYALPSCFHDFILNFFRYSESESLIQYFCTAAPVRTIYIYIF